MSCLSAHSVLCPPSASRECWCSIYSSQLFFFSHSFFLITEENLERVKRKQKQHHGGGSRHQCRADLIFKVLKLKTGCVEPRLVYYLYNFKLLLCSATPGKPLKPEWLEGTGSPDTTSKRNSVTLSADSCLTLTNSERRLSSTGAFALWATDKIRRWVEEYFFSLEWPNLPWREMRLWPTSCSF